MIRMCIHFPNNYYLIQIQMPTLLIWLLFSLHLLKLIKKEKRRKIIAAHNNSDYLFEWQKNQCARTSNETRTKWPPDLLLFVVLAAAIVVIFLFDIFIFGCIHWRFALASSVLRKTLNWTQMDVHRSFVPQTTLWSK